MNNDEPEVIMSIDADIGTWGKMLTMLMRQRGIDEFTVNDDEVGTMLDLPNEDQPLLVYFIQDDNILVKLTTNKEGEAIRKEMLDGTHKLKDTPKED